MVGIKGHLKASSLIETIVAALILLVTFGITMDLLVGVTLTDTRPDDRIEALTVMQDYYCESTAVFPGLGEQLKKYGWGELRIVISDYRSHLWQVTLTASLTAGKEQMTMTYLIAERTDINSGI